MRKKALREMQTLRAGCM